MYVYICIYITFLNRCINIWISVYVHRLRTDVSFFFTGEPGRDAPLRNPDHRASHREANLARALLPEDARCTSSQLIYPLINVCIHIAYIYINRHVYIYLFIHVYINDISLSFLRTRVAPPRSL